MLIQGGKESLEHWVSGYVLPIKTRDEVRNKRICPLGSVCCLQMKQVRLDMIGARIVRQSPIRSHAPDGGGGRRAETETETGSFLREESGLSLRIVDVANLNPHFLYVVLGSKYLHTQTFRYLCRYRGSVLRTISNSTMYMAVRVGHSA